jgi:hypothetical protein
MKAHQEQRLEFIDHDVRRAVEHGGGIDDPSRLVADVIDQIGASVGHPSRSKSQIEEAETVLFNIGHGSLREEGSLNYPRTGESYSPVKRFHGRPVTRYGEQLFTEISLSTNV